MLSQMLKPLEYVKGHLILALIYQNCGEMTSDNIDLREYHDIIVVDASVGSHQQIRAVRLCIHSNLWPDEELSLTIPTNRCICTPFLEKGVYVSPITPGGEFTSYIGASTNL
jgi:hypothetical protein